MRSTGEVMGIDVAFGTAFAKSQAAAYGSLPTDGRVFVSIANRDKRAMIFPVKRLADLGFEVLATEGTAQALRRNGVPADGGAQALRRGPTASRLSSSGSWPARSTWSSTRRPARHPPRPTATRSAPRPWRWASRHHHRAGLAAAVQGIEALVRGALGVRSLQDCTAQLRGLVTVDRGPVQVRGDAGRRQVRARCSVAGRVADTT